jgi:acetylornithine deacetylase
MNAVEVLRELVAIDSTSARSNLPVLDALERHARALGFQTRRLAYGSEKANLICSRGGEKGGLALVGHTDCVPFDAAWDGALKPEEREGKLFGRGAADTKAFLAAALTAASRTSKGPLQLVFTADEEAGCIGARKLQDEGALRPRYAIVGEPTRLTPVIGHKGYCLAEVIVRGAEGHSAYPETGKSAIFAAGRMLGEIEKIGQELQGERDAEFSPPYTTLNVGLIQGGKAKNVIPGSCSFTLEWRPLPSQEPSRVLHMVQQLGLGEVNVQRLDKGILQARNSPLVEFLRERTGNAPETIPFGTELPYLAALGAQACVFGPGDIRVAHRTGEFVPLDELHKAVDILAAAIEKFAA